MERRATHILLVEDDEGDAFLTTRLLHGATEDRFSVETATTAAAAVSRHLPW